MSPFTSEVNFTHATQDEDHGSRRAGPGIGAIWKDYTRRERCKGTLSSQEDNSLSITSDSVGVGSSNYGYTHNQPFPYPSYPIPVGMESSDLWKESETQSSNDFAYGQRQPISDPYGWHVNNYMQNYFGDFYHLMTTLHNTLTLHIELMKIVKILNLIGTLCGTKSLMYLTMQCIKCKILY